MLLLVFETRSYVSWLDLAKELRMARKCWSSCLSLLNAKIVGRYHHAWFYLMPVVITHGVQCILGKHSTNRATFLAPK